MVSWFSLPMFTRYSRLRRVPRVPAKKTLWIVLVILLPLAGFIIWYLFGPKAS